MIEQEDWGEEETQELPPRPRNRLAHPLPIALIAVLIGGLGFLAGVLVQKGSEGGGSLSARVRGVPNLSGAGAGSSSGSSTSAASRFPAFAGSGSAITGTVTAVHGETLYVKDAEGAVIEVKAAAGSTITREAKASSGDIHPGDRVVIEGSKSGARVKASSIRATESGVEAAAGFAPGFRAAGASASRTSSTESSLFGE